MVFGQVFPEGFDDGLNLPDEDARIPEEFARLQEGLRQFEVRFLGEALDLADDVGVRDLNVAVTRIGTCRFDADGQQGVVSVGEFETLADDLAEVLFVEDQVVGRGDDHLRVGILLQQRVGRIGDAGGRIAADRFAEHLPFADFGDVFEYEVLVFMVGHHEKVLGGDDFCKNVRKCGG